MWCTFVLIRDGNVGKYETIKSAILLITHIKSDYLLVLFHIGIFVFLSYEKSVIYWK